MSLWRQLTRGLRVLLRRQAADQDLADEVQHFFERAVEERIASGMSPADARRAVQLALGNPTVVRERVRVSGWERGIDTVVSDLRQGGRRLRAHPAFTAASVLTLALGIGASTAIFSVVNPVLFESLPYPGADRIAMIWDVGAAGARLDVTYGTFREVQERSRSFASLAAMRPWQPTRTGATEPERLDGQRVSAGYFRVLGVSPVLGRDFREAEDRQGGANVAILSDGLWQRRFGGDSAIVGRQVTLDDNSFTVIGVLPRAFENVLAPAAEIWTTLQYDMTQGRAWGHHLRMVGRLGPGVSASEAVRELAAIAGTRVPEFARPEWALFAHGLNVVPLQDDITGAVKPALLAVLGAVLLLLAIACVNVTNLLLARGSQRRGEFAVRAALGAARGRLIRQLLTESMLLGLLGGALGIVVAELGVRALVALSPPGLPRLGAIGVDLGAFVFALGISTFVGLLVGLVPALQASRGNLHGGLQHASRRTAGGRRFARGALVVAEVAFALVLLVSAGLLLRSLQRMFAVPPGFDAAQLLTMQVQTSGRRFDGDSATHRFFAEALAAVGNVPGVASAAFTSQLPLSGDFDRWGARFEGDAPGQGHEVFRYAVSPGFVETIGIPLSRGRLLDARDVAGAPPAVLISESLANRRFPGREAVGQRLRLGANDGPHYTIVGVVGDVKQASLAVSQPEAVYVTTSQWHFADRALWLVVRARADAPALAAAIRAAIWSVDRDQPIVRVASMNALLAASAAERRFALIVFEAFALAALVLAALGIHGVLASSVAERTRELGVRAALGASRGDTLALVVRHGLTLTAIGIAIGLGGAVAATRAVTSLLYGVSRLDPATYIGVIALLIGGSLVACALPAWRAARVEPSITLRAD